MKVRKEQTSDKPTVLGSFDKIVLHFIACFSIVSFHPQKRLCADCRESEPSDRPPPLSGWSKIMYSRFRG